MGKEREGKHEERRRRRKRKKGGREWMSGTLPACRSRMKNGVCSEEAGGGRSHFCITRTTTHLRVSCSLSLTHTHTLSDPFQQEGYIIELL